MTLEQIDVAVALAAFVLGSVGGTIGGAVMVWLGNRIKDVEILGHIEQHCREFQAVTERLKEYSERLRLVESSVAILDDRSQRR